MAKSLPFPPVENDTQLIEFTRYKGYVCPVCNVKQRMYGLVWYKLNPRPGGSSGGGASISTSKLPAEESKETVRLLARTAVVRGPCDLDLLVFLYRHPRSFLTSEMVAAFVGYDIKEVAKSLDAFIDAGLLERTQNPAHAARLYLLVLDGPEGGGALKTILKLASTREGRQSILQTLNRRRSDPPGATQKKSLLKIA